MSDRLSIAVIDDNQPQRMVLSKILEATYDVSPFDSGEAFLASTATFDAVILDIEMPGINGYETCRQLRSRLENSDTPVLFASSHDSAPERVGAYEAGGDDFITKPVAATELRHKLSNLLEQRRKVKDLAEQTSTAQQLAFTAMISMGDLGVVIEFLRKASAAKTYPDIASLLLDAMNAWGIKGAVQLRGEQGTIDRSTDGSLSTMQASVLDNMRVMGRIFEMGSRAIVNYTHVSILVENLPTQEPDKVGRLRDNLAILAEGADMRVTSLDTMQQRDTQKQGIHGALAELKNALSKTAERNQTNRASGQIHMLEALEHISHTLGTLGLTENQRNYVDDLIKCTLDDTRHFFDVAAGVDNDFAEVINRLEKLAAIDYSNGLVQG